MPTWPLLLYPFLTSSTLTENSWCEWTILTTTALFSPQECMWLDSPTQSYRRAKLESAFRFQPPTQTKISTTVWTLSSRLAESMESLHEQDKKKKSRNSATSMNYWTALNCLLEQIMLPVRHMSDVMELHGYICRSTEVNVIFVSAYLNKVLLLTYVGLCISRKRLLKR